MKNSNRVEQIIYNTIKDHANENFDNSKKYSTGIDSTESVLLNVIKDDNIVPQILVKLFFLWHNIVISAYIQR
jgi:hypothetical protein